MLTPRRMIFSGEFPPAGPEEDTDRVADILARYDGANRSYILHCVFSDHGEAKGLSPEEAGELLRCVLGPAEDFADDWANMSDGDKEAYYGDPTVREMVEAYAASAEESDEIIESKSPIGLLIGGDQLPLEGLAEAARRISTTEKAKE